MSELVIIGLTFSSYSLPQSAREHQLSLVCLEKIDVDIEAAALSVRDWSDKLGVCFALSIGPWRVDEGFAIFGIYLAVLRLSL